MIAEVQYTITIGMDNAEVLEMMNVGYSSMAVSMTTLSRSGTAFKRWRVMFGVWFPEHI